MLKYAVKGGKRAMQYGYDAYGNPGACKLASTQSDCYNLPGCTVRHTSRGAHCVALPGAAKQRVMVGFSAPLGSTRSVSVYHDADSDDDLDSVVHLYADSTGTVYSRRCSGGFVNPPLHYCGQSVVLLDDDEAVETAPTVDEVASKFKLKGQLTAITVADAAHLQVQKFETTDAYTKAEFLEALRKSLGIEGDAKAKLYRIDVTTLNAGTPGATLQVNVAPLSLDNIDDTVVRVLYFKTKEVFIPVFPAYKGTDVPAGKYVATTSPSKDVLKHHISINGGAQNLRAIKFRKPPTVAAAAAAGLPKAKAPPSIEIIASPASVTAL